MYRGTYVSRNLGRPIKLLESIPTQHKSQAQKGNVSKKVQPIKKKIDTNAWQRNYINKYTTLFEVKERLKIELAELKSLLKRTNSRPDTVDKSTQTDPLTISNQSVQTDPTIISAPPQQEILVQHQSQIVPETSSTNLPANIEPSPIGIVPSPISPPNPQPNAKEKAKKQPKSYVCECGYNAGDRKNRLTNHQNEHCKLYPRTVKSDYLCPICGINKTYNAMKSHLLQFANVNRKNKTREVSGHAGKDAAYHLRELEKFKAKYGPKKTSATKE